MDEFLIDDEILTFDLVDPAVDTIELTGTGSEFFELYSVSDDGDNIASAEVYVDAPVWEVELSVVTTDIYSSSYSYAYAEA